MHGILTGHRGPAAALHDAHPRPRREPRPRRRSTSPSADEEQFLPGIDEQLTAVEILDRIVDRDGAAISATTELAQAASPATRLHEAAQRYADAVTTATQRLLGPDADRSARIRRTGPLPWLPGIPADVRKHPQWSSYLTARADRVDLLADQVRRDTAAADVPGIGSMTSSPPKLRDEVIVWRAANGVPDDDRSLLGPDADRLGRADRYARHLQRQVDDLYPASVRRWEQRVAESIGSPDHRDEHTLDLARELDRLERTGMNAGLMLRRASTGRPLPREHTTEALAYRIQQYVKRSQWVAPDPPRQPVPPSRGLGL